MKGVACVVAVAALGCVTPGQPIVRDLKIVGNHLDVETCTLPGEGSKKLTNCAHSLLPLHVVAAAARPTSLSITLAVDDNNVAAQLAAVRPALERCKPGREPVEIRLVIDGTGQVTSAEPVTTARSIHSCMTKALATMRFAVQPAAFTFTFEARKH